MAIQQVQNLPPQFIQDIGKDLATQITAQSAVPVVATGIAGITQQPGEDAAQFKARQDAATQFGIRQQSLAGLAPQVAQQDALQTQAQTLAQQGVGSFQPFLTAAQQAAGDAATTVGGIATGAPTTQQVQDFMSPYQSQVIDATLAEFDRNRAIQEQSIAQAQQGLGSFQSGLGGQQQALAGTDITRLGQLGALNQAQAQAQLDAQREAARMTAFQPQEQLDRFAGQVTGLMGGVAGQGTQTTNIPNPTPLQTALGIGTTLSGIYGQIGRGTAAFKGRGIFGDK
jgi:hypothetical protein